MKTHHTFTYWVHICSILTAPLLGAHLYCLDIGSFVLLGTLFDWSTGFLFHWLLYNSCHVTGCPFLPSINVGCSTFPVTQLAAPVYPATVLVFMLLDDWLLSISHNWLVISYSQNIGNGSPHHHCNKPRYLFVAHSECWIHSDYFMFCKGKSFLTLTVPAGFASPSICLAQNCLLLKVSLNKWSQSYFDPAEFAPNLLFKWADGGYELL